MNFVDCYMMKYDWLLYDDIICVMFVWYMKFDILNDFTNDYIDVNIWDVINCIRFDDDIWFILYFIDICDYYYMIRLEFIYDFWWFDIIWFYDWLCWFEYLYMIA